MTSVWTYTIDSEAEQAAFIANKPYLVGTNLLRRRTRAPVWSSSGLWSDSATSGVGANIDNTALPTRYLYNDNLYDYTSPGAGAIGLGTIYLLLDLTAGTAYDFVFNNVFLSILNGSSFTNFSAALELADDGDFTTHTNLAKTFTPWGGLTAKMISGFLIGPGGNVPHLFASVQFARIKFVTTDVGGFTTVGSKVPQFSELWLSAKRQLAHNPREPFDDEPRSSFAQDFVSPYGGLGRDARFSGRQTIPLRFRPTTSTASLSGLDELTALRSWFRDADNGLRPFLYVDQPSSGPASQGKGHFMYLPEPELLAESLGSLAARTFEARAVELPPFQSIEIFA